MAPKDTTQLAAGKQELDERQEELVAERPPLRECVRNALEAYFSHLEGHSTSGLYRMVMDEIEVPLLEVVLRQTRGNHTRAAELLGINRGTLRKKLKQQMILG